NAKRINVVTRSSLPEYMLKTKIVALCDVNAAAFGSVPSLADFLPQKGVTSEQIPEIQQAIKIFWSHLQKNNPFIPSLESPFMGAGGGLCLGLATIFPNFSMELGASRIARMAALAQSFHGADLAVCGEGCLDSQTTAGKAPAIVSKIAQEQGVRIAGVFGKISGDTNTLLSSLGIKDSFVITSTQLMHSGAELTKLSKNRFHEIGIEIAHLVEASSKKNGKSH
ncbi:MAG: hypothetical protein RIR26_1720, partial [Pseudomonadota bacterium]